MSLVNDEKIKAAHWNIAGNILKSIGRSPVYNRNDTRVFFKFNLKSRYTVWFK